MAGGHKDETPGFGSVLSSRSSAKVLPYPTHDDDDDDYSPSSSPANFGLGVTGVSRLSLQPQSSASLTAAPTTSTGGRRQSIAMMKLMKDAQQASVKLSTATLRKYSRAVPISAEHRHVFDSVRSTEIYTEGDDAAGTSVPLDTFLEEDEHSARARMLWQRARRVLYALKVYRILKESLEETKMYGKMVDSRRLSLIKLRQMAIQQEYEQEVSLPMGRRTQRYVRRLLARIPVIFPEEAFARNFGICASLLIVYTMIAIPAMVALSPHTDKWTGCFHLIMYAVDCFFVADIVLQFRTAVHVDDEFHVVARPKMIAWYYATTWLPLDLLTTLPLELIARACCGTSVSRQEVVILNLLQLPRVLRIVRLNRIARCIERSLVALPRNALLLYRQLVLLIFFTHMMACALVYAAFLEDEYGGDTRSWITRFELEQAIERAEPSFRLSAGFKYLYALYWAVAIVSTVGYGDFSAQTDCEAVLVVVCIIIGATLYVVTIGKVAYMLQALDRETAVFDDKMDKVRFYLQSRKVPQGLRMRILNYYRYLWSRHRFFSDIDVMNDLNSSLTADLSTHQARHLLNRIPIFQGATQDFLNAISDSLEPIVFSPGDRITCEGENVREMVFITQGEVAVKKGQDINKDGAIIALLGEGSFFGEISVLFSEPRCATVVASAFTDCMILTEEHCTRFITSESDIRDRLMTVAAKRIERMAVWVTGAVGKGYVPLGPGDEAQRRLKSLVQKAKCFQKRQDKERMASVVEESAMQRTKTVRGPKRKEGRKPERRASATGVASSRQEKMDLSAFLNDLEEEEEHDISLKSFSNKSKVVTNKPSRFMDRHVSILVSNSGDEDALPEPRRSIRTSASALPEPSTASPVSSHAMNSRSSHSRRKTGGSISLAPAAESGLECIALRRVPEALSITDFFTDAADRCGMDRRGVHAMAESLQREFITSVAALYVSYPSPSDLLKKYDWPRGFVSTLYLILREREEERPR